jgi:hypothetical protein
MAMATAHSQQGAALRGVIASMRLPRRLLTLYESALALANGQWPMKARE